MPSRVSGLSIGYATAGGIILWSGIKGWTIQTTFRNLLAGKTPTANTEPVISSSPSPASVTVSGSSKGGNPAANQLIGKTLAGGFGWATGNEWQSLVQLWTRESGWNNLAVNPSSGALGIAQALGHGNSNTQGTVKIQGSLRNEYGGYGVSDTVAQAANSGSPSGQIIWGLNYIQQTYGDPVNAWTHETQNGWY